MIETDDPHGDKLPRPGDVTVSAPVCYTAVKAGGHDRVHEEGD
jgi:hypothetical protein